METITLKETNDITIKKNIKSKICDFRLNPDSPQFNDMNLILDISDYITQLPSESLKEIAYTAVLEDELYELREFNYCIALYFWILDFEVEGYSFEDAHTNQLVLELAEFTALKYLWLWRIIKTEFTDLKRQLSNCPETAIELFKKIIDEELNIPFETLLTFNYLEYNPSQLGKGFQELLKPTKNINLEKLKKLAPIHCRNTSEFSLKANVIQIIEKQASQKNKHKLRYLCDSFNSATRRLLEILSDAANARNNQGKLLPTVVWINGIREYKSWGRNRQSPQQ